MTKNKSIPGRDSAYGKQNKHKPAGASRGIEAKMKCRILNTIVIVLCMATVVFGAQAVASNDGNLTIADANNVLNKLDKGFIKDGKLDLDAVIEYVEDMYRSGSSISQMTLIVTKPRQTREVSMKVWTRGKEKALIVIESPAREKGTATLKVEKNLWNYLPRIKRTIRIPPSMMLASWMGSDFTNDDLVREASYTEDYTYNLKGWSNDPNGWLVCFDSKPDVVGLWKRWELVVSANGRIPLVARYYDRKNRLSRTMRWSNVRQFDGRRLPAKMEMVPEDKEGHKTELVYEEIDFDVDVPESTFSLSRLERKR